MDNPILSSSQNRIAPYDVKNTLKSGSELLDKLSRIFVRNIAYKYSMKVLEIIDVQSVRIIMVEDDNNTLYAISLINNHMVNNGNHNLTLTDIGRITKEIAYNKNAIAASSFVKLD
jgi:hypothetical protein